MYARQGAGALAMLCVIGGDARAQETPPGLTARLDITQRLEFSDNPDFDVDGNSDFFGRTILGFGLESVTNLQRFTLNLGTDIEEGRDDRSGVDVTNSFASLRYDRNTRNASIGVSAEYRESDTSSSFFDDFDIDGNVINQDSGTRETYRFGLEGAVGREAPVGSSFSWNYSEIRYRDTNDLDLTDQSTSDFQGQVDFRITPQITTSLTGKYIDFDAQGNGTNRRTTGLGLSTALEINPILTADVGLSYDRIERSGDETGTDEGLSVDLGLIRTMPKGSVGLQFSSDITSNDNGRRSYLSVTRNLELPRGDLSVELGVTGADTIGNNPLVNINYQHELPTAALSFGVSQRVVIDSDNNEQINTTLRAGYDQQINSQSSYGVSATFYDRNDLSGAEDDGQRIDISLNYRHDLTRDWGLVSGISYAHSTEDDGEDRRQTTIFVGLQRSFDWIP
ncbi:MULTISPECIES: hypothetical protein [Rhodobacterales]|uniref:hypothetical protein n=1 Tax=Rhodobacterales TaxID=204455 RepID=UPI003298537A